MKRAGVLSTEAVGGIRRYMRKFGFYPAREDVWHLVDTVDAHRLVIERLLDGWQVPTSLTDYTVGWWLDALGGSRDPEEMSRAEQLVLYDRVVRPNAPAWPGEGEDT